MGCALKLSMYLSVLSYVFNTLGPLQGTEFSHLPVTLRIGGAHSIGPQAFRSDLPLK